MAFQKAVYVCDWCGETQSFEEKDEGVEEGWVLLEARWLQDGTASYCCTDCLVADLA
jgi:hypothetical protein